MFSFVHYSRNANWSHLDIIFHILDSTHHNNNSYVGKGGRNTLLSTSGKTLTYNFCEK